MVLMTDYLIDGEILGDIADAIREKTGSTDTITPENMAQEIASITVGGNTKITDLTDSTWYIPSGWLVDAGYGTFQVDFNITVHDTETTNLWMQRLHMGYTEITPLAFEGGGSVVELAPIKNNIVVSQLGYVAYRVISNVYAVTVTFTGGNDATNTSLINWLYTYGELQTLKPEPTPEIDLSDYQTKIDENLETKSKEIVGAINEVNGKTVDKVKSIDTWYDGVSELDKDDGIYWKEGFAFFDETDLGGNILKTGDIHHRVPIVAGDNITFEVDDENQVVKINATGGGSSTPSVSLIGTWRVIYEPEIPTSDIPLEFTCNGTEYIAIGKVSVGSSSWGINALAYQAGGGGYYDNAYTNNPSGSYGITHGWRGEDYRFLTITKEPTDAKAIAWLGANTDAPKIELPKEEMPQIRFASANGNDLENSTFYVGEESPLKLTVEIVGGGALKVGDQLQVCKRKRFDGCRANGYKRKYKLQRFAEYVVTEEDLNKRFLTVNIVLNKGKVFHGLFRDGDLSRASPLYLRIRRGKGDIQNNISGQTVDASFSNIVTIWKTHHRGNQAIRIY